MIDVVRVRLEHRVDGMIDVIRVRLDANAPTVCT